LKPKNSGFDRGEKSRKPFCHARGPAVGTKPGSLSEWTSQFPRQLATKS
jgi:hypothetical protein